MAGANRNAVQPGVRVYDVDEFGVVLVDGGRAQRRIECGEGRIERGYSLDFRFAARFLVHTAADDAGHLAAQRVADNVKGVGVQALVEPVQDDLGRFWSQLRRTNRKRRTGLDGYFRVRNESLAAEVGEVVQFAGAWD